MVYIVYGLRCTEYGVLSGSFKEPRGQEPFKMRMLGLPWPLGSCQKDHGP